MAAIRKPPGASRDLRAALKVEGERADLMEQQRDLFAVRLRRAIKVIPYQLERAMIRKALRSVYGQPKPRGKRTRRTRP